MIGRAVVYGVDHSPWVQGVCLSLHRQGVYGWSRNPHPQGYRSGGMIMPVVRWSEGGQTSDSFAVYERLAQRCVLQWLGMYAAIRSSSSGSLSATYLLA